MNHNGDLQALGERIAIISLNPNGFFVRSILLGFATVGIQPHYMVRLGLKTRLRREWRRHRLSIIGKFVLPKLRQAMRLSTVDVGLGPMQPKCLVKVSALNSEQTKRFLVEHRIKYLVNGGADIFRDEILSIPGLIVVNAHAGSLPRYRNMNVVEWAIYNNEKVIGTVHRVDRGIDSGPIMMEKILDMAGARTRQEAREIAFHHVAMMIGPAVKAHHLGISDEVPQQSDAATIWYTMHSFFADQVDARLAEHAPAAETNSDLVRGFNFQTVKVRED